LGAQPPAIRAGTTAAGITSCAGPFCAICQDIAEKGYEGLVLTRH